MESKALINKFIAKLRETYKDQLKYVLMYGSCARNEEGPDSDIDLMVVLEKMDDFWSDFAKIQDIAYETSFGAGINKVISALPITHEQYQTGGSPFILNVKKEQKIVE